MTASAHDFGFLTLATEHDFLKAIGLALSLRISNPGLPVAVACTEKSRPLLEPYFDHVVPEIKGLRGFVHKVHLDRYTPFRNTAFFDSDVLIFKAVWPYVSRWGNGPYYACGAFIADGVSGFGMNRQAVLRKIHKPKLVTIDGAGHAFFRTPDAHDVFETARSITENYDDYAPGSTYADEDVMAIAMTMHDLQPAPYEDFFARHLSIKPGTLKMDVTRGYCSFVAANTDLQFEPCMMHFANNEGAIDYTRQLIRLFRHFDVPSKGLMSLGLSDLFNHRVRTPVSRTYRSLFKHSSA